MALKRTTCDPLLKAFNVTCKLSPKLKTSLFVGQLNLYAMTVGAAHAATDSKIIVRTLRCCTGKLRMANAVGITVKPPNAFSYCKRTITERDDVSANH